MLPGSASPKDSPELAPWDEEGKDADPNTGEPWREALPPWMLMRSVHPLYPQGSLW